MMPSFSFFQENCGRGSAVEHRLIERQQALARVGAREVVLGVWNVAKILLAFKLAEIELRVVGQEELIARRVNQVLRDLEPLAIAIVVRVFDGQDVLILGRADLVGKEFVIDVVVERRSRRNHKPHSDAG